MEEKIDLHAFDMQALDIFFHFISFRLPCGRSSLCPRRRVVVEASDEEEEGESVEEGELLKVNASMDKRLIGQRLVPHL